MRIFPALQHHGLLFNSGEYIYWDDPGTGVKIGHRFSGPKLVRGAYHAEKFRVMSVSEGQRAYSLGDYSFDSKDFGLQCHTLVVADADTFWKWTFDDLVGRLREGLPKVDDYRENRFHTLGYEEAFGMLCSAHQYSRAVALRLTHAATAAVKNPTVDLKVVRLPVKVLGDRSEERRVGKECRL